MRLGHKEILVPAALPFVPAIDVPSSIMIIERIRTALTDAFQAVSASGFTGHELGVHRLAELNETQSQRWQRLMIAAQAGEPRAYSEFLQEASSFIRVIARRYHSDAGTIEDVVQETLISIHRIRQTYEPGRAVEPWIAAIAKARAIDALRARLRRLKMETPVAPDVLANIPDSMRSSESALAANTTIAEAMAALPPAQRAAVRLLRIEELSLREASVASGQSVSALKSSLHRAMQSLRSVLTGGRDA